MIYTDTYNADISNEMIVDMESVNNVLSDALNSPESPSFFSVMHEIAQRQKCLFLTLPIYNNKDVEDIFKPYNIYDGTHSLNDSGATYVILYPGETSHILNGDGDENDFVDDGFDIANYSGNTQEAADVFGKGGFNKCAFGVTYGMQNQNYFKDIKISMDDPSVTDYSIANTLKLAEGAKDGDTNTAIFLSNSLYPIFANRSYNCTIEMMGCAEITPLMYFQLNNIPMFRGAYIITNVTHKITPEDFITTFTGTRIPKFNYEVNRKVFDTDDLLNRLKITTNEKYTDITIPIMNDLDNEAEIIHNESMSVDIKKVQNNSIVNKSNIEDIKDDNNIKIVTFAQYPINSIENFDKKCNSSLKKLLANIALTIKNNNYYSDMSVKIISGYRKGDGSSQHYKGEAMDLQAIRRINANDTNPSTDRGLNKKLFSLLCRFVNKKEIDNLLWELHVDSDDLKTTGPTTLHVTCLEDTTKNRGTIGIGRIQNNKFISYKDKTEQWPPLYSKENENINESKKV